MNQFDEEYKKIKDYYDDGVSEQKIMLLRERLQERPLVIFGVGEMGIANARFCIENNIKIDCFCDSNFKGIMSEFSLSVLSPTDVWKKYKNANIIISSATFYDEMFDICLQLGFSQDRIVDDFPQQLGRVSIEELNNHLDGYRWAYNFFTDEQSKELILSRIKALLFGTVMKKSRSMQYFEDGIIELSNKEVFVDAGGYIGDTIEDFISIVGDNYKHIYTFEPDTNNFSILEKKYGSNGKIDIITKGLWNVETELQFTENGPCGSFVNASGEDTIPVTTIDIFFDRYPSEEKPTYIKMDIEGAEKELLLGAENLIRETKPKLAVCVYHKLQDIYELPQILHQFNPQYNMFLRHYTRNVFDTVLYAIPR
jgi:FkbM family methyltransferase